MIETGSRQGAQRTSRKRKKSERRGVLRNKNRSEKENENKDESEKGKG